LRLVRKGEKGKRSIRTQEEPSVPGRKKKGKPVLTLKKKPLDTRILTTLAERQQKRRLSAEGKNLLEEKRESRRDAQESRPLRHF